MLSPYRPIMHGCWGQGGHFQAAFAILAILHVLALLGFKVTTIDL